MSKLQRICAWCKSEINDDNSRGKQLTDEEYKAASKTATHGKCAKCVVKKTKQLDLFESRLTSLPADGKPGDGGLEQPASLGNGKIHFDAADLAAQLREMCEGNHIKVKTNIHQDIAVNIRSTDKGDTITVNPKRWRGTKKTARLTDFIIQAAVNSYG